MIFLQLILFFVGGTLLILQLLKRRRAKNHPPDLGIFSSFLVNVLYGHHWAKLITNLGKLHGPVVQLGLGPMQYVLINGLDAVKEACRIPSLNGRVKCMYKEVLGGNGILWADETSQKRKFVLRNTRHFTLSGKAAEENIHEEIDLLFQHLDSFNENHFSVIKAFNIHALNGVLHRLLGEKAPADDPALLNVVRGLTLIAEMPTVVVKLCVMAPGLTKWVPEYFSGRNKIEKILRDMVESFRPYLDSHRRTRRSNQPRDFMDSLMDEVEGTTDPDSDFHPSRDPINPILYDMMSAAIETTGVTLEWMVLYLSHFPAIQKKLHVEVDREMGLKRLPEVCDRAAMPYLQAFIHEVFRLAPATPTGFHMAVEDTNFRGYTIEKGVGVLINFYGIHRDPLLWDNPDEFKPERFIHSNGEFMKSDNLFTFGFGKRSCIGEVTARDQIFLYLARILQAYEVNSDKRVESFDGVSAMSNHCPAFIVKFIQRTDCDVFVADMPTLKL